MVVVRDCYADPDAELHAVLLDIVIAKQAAVVTTAELAGALGASPQPAIPDRDIATLDPPEFPQPLHKSRGPLARSRRRERAKEPHGLQLPRLLRARRKGPAGRHDGRMIIGAR